MQGLKHGDELASQYRIEEMIGAGGFGMTYKAYEKAFDRVVAIKEYFPLEFAARDGKKVRPRDVECGKMFDFYREMFRGEGQALAKFNSPNIVHVHQILDANETTYLVLEYVDGVEFESWLKSLAGRPSQRQLDDILIPLLAALSEIHGAGYIHRDISPRNFMVTRQTLSPKLLDFGAARSRQSSAITAVDIAQNMYSAPEMYSTNQSYQGPWTDIYSLAATLYRAVAGFPPPQAPSRMLDDTMVPLAKVVDTSAYRPKFLEAIGWGLALARNRRPQTINEWQRLLLPSQEPLNRQSRRNPDADRIFISYRRSDSEQIAGRMFDRLSVDFGAHRVFFDSSAIPSGVDFREHIAAAMKESAVVIAVIGPNWIPKHTILDWLRRRQKSEDHVLAELELAATEAVPLVPVLVGGVQMPKVDRLPLAARGVARANAAVVRNGREFHADMDRVVSIISQLMPSR